MSPARQLSAHSLECVNPQYSKRNLLVTNRIFYPSLIKRLSKQSQMIPVEISFSASNIGI